MLVIPFLVFRALSTRDIQELTRIFFNGVESSLVGTSCQVVIRKLCSGTFVAKVNSCEG